MIPPTSGVFAQLPKIRAAETLEQGGVRPIVPA
jgi:hypothetical protein